MSQQELHLMPNSAAAHLPLGTVSPIEAARRRYPPGPERAREIIRVLERDAGELPPIDESAPKPVRDARRAFDEAVRRALEAIDEVVKASSHVLEAREKDIEAAASALRQGRAQPQELTVTRARQAEEGALIALEAASRAVEQAHLQLTEACRKHWATWRRSMVQAALESDVEAKRELEKLAGLLEDRRRLALSTLRLDQQMTGRYRGLREKAEAQQRCGLEIFKVAVQRFFPKNHFDSAEWSAVEQGIAGLREHLNREMPWLTEWAPPGDEQQRELLERPLPLESQWVREAVWPPNGICPRCGRLLPADAPITENLEVAHECSTKGRRLVPARDGIGYVWA